MILKKADFKLAKVFVTNGFQNALIIKEQEVKISNKVITFYMTRCEETKKNYYCVSFEDFDFYCQSFIFQSTIQPEHLKNMSRYDKKPLIAISGFDCETEQRIERINVV